MTSLETSIPFLTWEAQALLARLGQLEPLSLRTPAAPAAALAPAAMSAIEEHLIRERRELRKEVLAFLAWLKGAAGRAAPPHQHQQRFALLKMRFNAELDSLDIFADVLNQRSEHDTGLWLGGLDAAASDGLRRPGFLTMPPAVVTYLDRGHGAAIRRARTRLPGRGTNPVAVIRVPRERMVGSGIGSSLLHEVGHQAAAILDLVTSLRGALRQRAARASSDLPAWRLWERWISEIVADLWALGTLGISATTGLIGVISLPRHFVFRMRLDDPHPLPWVRVVLSCEMGRQLFRDPQWDHLERLWADFYPAQSQSFPRRRLLQLLLGTMPDFVRLLLEHRSARLQWRSLREALPASARSPARLRQLYRSSSGDISQLCNVSPTLAMAAIGQAAADKRLAPTTESRLLRQLLRHWALKRVIAQEANNSTCDCQLPSPSSQLAVRPDNYR